MCGRCACTKDPSGIQAACAYRKKGSGKKTKPSWISPNSQKYYPSYNVSPQTNTPVVLSGGHAHVKEALSFRGGDDGDSDEGTERVIQVMKWGLIPSWHRGDPGSFPTLLNNCRYDGMLEKPSFRPAVSRRQRCVVLADGFYEWCREKGKQKQPYYIYFSSSAEEASEPTPVTTAEAGFVPDKMSQSRLLTMAGLFEIWTPQSPGEEEELFTYTVITVEATDSFGCIHHRMPAILEDTSAVDQWLDPQLSTAQALKVISPCGSNCLSWHPVSSLVNNVRNKSSDCVVKIDLEEKASSSKKGTLLNWFSASPSKTKRSVKVENEGELSSHKRFKEEET